MTQRLATIIPAVSGEPITTQPVDWTKAPSLNQIYSITKPLGIEYTERVQVKFNREVLNLLLNPAGDNRVVRLHRALRGRRVDMWVDEEGLPKGMLGNSRASGIATLCHGYFIPIVGPAVIFWSE